MRVGPFADCDSRVARQFMLTALAVANYRSLRDLVLPLEGLNLITGPNGSG